MTVRLDYLTGQWMNATLESIVPLTIALGSMF